LVVRRPVLAFLAVSFLLQVAHGIYYTLKSLHLEQAGYSRADIGLFWALSEVAEIVLFAVMHRLMTNFSLRGILVYRLLTAAIRWLLIVFFVEVVAVQIVAQCLHAFSFGACHAVSMEYLRRFFPSHQRGRGQAIYTSLSFGAGGALGALAGGQFWAISPVATFVFATLVSVVAAIIAYIWLDGRRQSSQALAELLL
jgi:PPP family 3-phenylpropionic acid transporter